MYGFLFDLNRKREGKILIQNVDICGPEASFFRQIIEKTQPTFLCNIFLYNFFSEMEVVDSDTLDVEFLKQILDKIKRNKENRY